MKSVENVQVVILVGGLGTRLKPYTDTLPKPLVPVAGKPYLQWQLEYLAQRGFKKILLLTGYRGEMIEECFGDGTSLGLKISYQKEEQLLGTGGAVFAALTLLDDQFLLLNGDSFLPIALNQFWEDSRKTSLPATLAVLESHAGCPVIGNIQLKEARVVAYQKDAGPSLGFSYVDAGVYFLEKAALAFKKDLGPKFQLESLWPDLMAQGKLGAYLVSENFYDIGTPERLKQFEGKVRDYF